MAYVYTCRNCGSLPAGAKRRRILADDDAEEAISKGALPLAPGHRRNADQTSALARRFARTLPPALIAAAFVAFDSGRCPYCLGFYHHEKRSVDDEDSEGAEVASYRQGEAISAPDLLASVKEPRQGGKRETGWPGLDYIGGGGLPRVNTILLPAIAGTGKTTFLLSLCQHLAATRRVSTCYCTTEQSLPELAELLRRIAPRPSSRLTLVDQTEADDIIGLFESTRARILVLDSINEVQGVMDDDGNVKTTGGHNALAEFTRQLKRIVDEKRCLLFGVGHVNMNGEMKGGSTILHTFGARLSLRHEGVPEDPGRILYYDGKCRFAPLGRKARLEMRSDGFVDCGPYQHQETSLAHG